MIANEINKLLTTWAVVSNINKLSQNSDRDQMFSNSVTTDNVEEVTQEQALNKMAQKGMNQVKQQQMFTDLKESILDETTDEIGKEGY